MNGLADSRSHAVIPASGLTVLVDPDEPSLDIVFIHGFTGHPERTWSHLRGNAGVNSGDHSSNESVEPPLKTRRLNPFSRSFERREDSSTAVYWPRDLVPLTVPGARVLTYGYDTHIRHWLGPPVSQNTVCDIAWDFLVALEAERRLEPSRPVLFIVHSLGGIVVKEMLRRSSGCSLGHTHLCEIFKSTIGIMFFGTPHGGADPRGVLQRIAEKAIKVAGFSVNEQIVNTLLPSSERLRELRDEFIPMAYQEKWAIHSFQEQLGVQILSGHKVVEDTSSYLNLPTIETTEHIGRNHMQMCRFTGLEDVEYRKVNAALCRMVSKLSEKPKCSKVPSPNEEQKRMLLDSLKFDQIDVRQMTIKNAHAKTCKWLVKKPEYLDWLDVNKLSEHYGFLWIKGKPGTGKSTLMKFALANARRTMKDRIIVSFFFNARGEHLEKSTIGMYRSLLLQLLERVPELQCVLETLELTTWSSSGYHQWGVESLKDLFGQAVQTLGRLSLVCFIDALDECDEGQIRDMVSFFEHVGEAAVSSRIRFQVCFSSRHYPYITMRKGLAMTLEGQEGHNQDITNYLDSELKIGQSKLAQQIRGELQVKASEIFIWVVLVVEILNKEHDNGRIHALRQRLRDIPNDLHELFRDILTRDCHNRNELLLCIQWVLFARQPLKPEQLYFAILSGAEPEALSRWNCDEITIDAIKRFVLNSSKGLAEITKSKAPTVQFIHESVRDFLLKGNGLSVLWPGVGNNFQGQSHERLKQCCLTYMCIDTTTTLDLSKSLPKAPSQEAAALRQSALSAFPFLEYAVHNVLHHANEAEGDGIDQGDFIKRFPLANWIKLDNLFEKYEIRQHTLGVSLLYILAEGNMANLIKRHPKNLLYLNVEDERYGIPLFAALATGSDEAVGAFMRVEAEQQPTTTLLRELYSQHSQSRSKRVNFGRDFKFSRRKAILSYVFKHGDEILFAFLFETGKAMQDGVNKGDWSLLSETTLERYLEVVKLLIRPSAYSESREIDGTRGPSPRVIESGHTMVVTPVEANWRDDNGRTLFSWAATLGHGVVVKLLLATGSVDINSRDNSGSTPLSLAAEISHEAVVKLLLSTGNVDINSRDNRGSAPLSLAVRNSHEAIVKLLLSTGNVDINSRDNSGLTPLSLAARYGNEALVRLLLSAGNVNADLSDNDGRTPLSQAAGSGDEAVVKLLLSKGNVNADSRDNGGRTPLSWAAGSRNEAVVKLLLSTGNVNADSRDNGGRTPLSWAAGYGGEAVVKLLLSTGNVNADLSDNDGRTPLSWAAGSRNEAVVKLLLSTGKVNADLSDNGGRTPLSWAAGYGDEAVVKLLLSTGNVNADLSDNGGRTPLSWAAGYGDEAVVKLLLSTGNVNADSRDNCGRTPLSRAAGSRNEAVVKLLLSTGNVNADSRDNGGRTPLSWAAGYGGEAVVKLLLSTGNVNADSRDNCGRTPLSQAAGFWNEAVVKLLLSTENVNADSRDNNGRTLLSWAAGYGGEAVVKLLLSTRNVDADSKDDQGRTPLWYAIEEGVDWRAKKAVPLLLATGKVNPYAVDQDGKSPLLKVKEKAEDTDAWKEILEMFSVD